MAAKKTTPQAEATSRVVEVSVPAVKGIALNDIYKAALTSVRNEIPLVSNLTYDIVGSEKKGEGERVYQVEISWADRDEAPAPTDPADGDFVGQRIASLEVPSVLPGSDPDA